MEISRYICAMPMCAFSKRKERNPDKIARQIHQYIPTLGRQGMYSCTVRGMKDSSEWYLSSCMIIAFPHHFRTSSSAPEHRLYPHLTIGLLVEYICGILKSNC